MNLVSREAGNPDNHREDVTQGDEPQSANNPLIMQDLAAHHNCHPQPQQQDDAKHDPSPRGAPRKQEGKQRPGDPEAESQTDITPGARVSTTAGPAKLMFHKTSRVVGGQKSLNHDIRQSHRSSVLRNAKT